MPTSCTSPASTKRLGAATELWYRELQWGDAEALALARVARTGVLHRLEVLVLDTNSIGGAGALALAEAICDGVLPSLSTLCVVDNTMDAAEQAALREACEARGAVCYVGDWNSVPPEELKLVRHGDHRWVWEQRRREHKLWHDHVLWRRGQLRGVTALARHIRQAQKEMPRSMSRATRSRHLTSKTEAKAQDSKPTFGRTPWRLEPGLGRRTQEQDILIQQKVTV
jgi:hypothetical protein